MYNWTEMSWEEQVRIFKSSQVRGPQISSSQVRDISNIFKWGWNSCGPRDRLTIAGGWSVSNLALGSDTGLSSALAWGGEMSVSKDGRGMLERLGESADPRSLYLITLAHKLHVYLI